MAHNVTPIECSHQHLRTTATASAVKDNAGKVLGFRLELEAKCADCGTPFHFPNYIRNDEGKQMSSAYVTHKMTRLNTPILPGYFAPEEN